MKKLYLIHGWDGSPEEPMHKWIAEKTRERGYEVFNPLMPNPEEPKISDWLNKISEITNNGESIDEETIFIGHSVGCQAVLRYFEILENKKAGKTILIALWMKLDEQTIKEEGEDVVEVAKPWMETPIDFEKVKKACAEFICIFSDNDPYVPLSEKDFLKEKLNAKTLVLNNRWHFDPDSGIDKLPEILEFLE